MHDLTPLILFVAWLLSLFGACHMGASRGRGFEGFALGFFFGPVGMICAGLLPPTARWEAKHRLAIKRELDRLLSEKAEPSLARRAGRALAPKTSPPDTATPVSSSSGSGSTV